MKQSKFYQIKNITEHEYTLVGCDGSVITRPIQEVDKTASAFTIQDAKDGDILVVENIFFIYKRALASHIVSYCKLINDVFEPTVDARTCCEGNSNVHPATKEQRDLFFAKMKENGYEFDFEKKELKKIENEIEIPFGAKDSELQEATYYIPKGFHAEIDGNKVVISRKSCVYNPYKAVVESIAKMCDKYKSRMCDEKEAKDFLANVAVKCREAAEYDKNYSQ